jgi:hypothetical protein
MPVSPELLSALRAYERLWRTDASDADVEAAFAAGFTDDRPGAPEAGDAEFAVRDPRRAHRRALDGRGAAVGPYADDRAGPARTRLGFEAGNRDIVSVCHGYETGPGTPSRRVFGQLARRAGSSRGHASKRGKGAPAWRSTRSW